MDKGELIRLETYRLILVRKVIRRQMYFNTSIEWLIKSLSGAGTEACHAARELESAFGKIKQHGIKKKCGNSQDVKGN